VEHPKELVVDVAVQLGADKTLLGGKHIMVLRVTGTGGIKKTDFSFIHGNIVIVIICYTSSQGVSV
jgi:hypothetical protein